MSNLAGYFSTWPELRGERSPLILPGIFKGLQRAYQLFN